MVVRNPFESMLDDQTTSTWIPRNKFGLPVGTSDDMGDWEQSFEEITPTPAPRFALEQPTLRRWPVRPAQRQPPMVTQPMHQQPMYQAPPMHQQPAYHEPAYHEPAYREPAYREPAYHEPAYPQPAYHEHGYQQPAMHQQPAPHVVESRQPTLRAVPPPAARPRTLKGGHAAPPAPAWQVAVEAEHLRASNALPFWFRTLLPGLALFGAMLFAGVILFVDPPASLSLKTQPQDVELRVDGELVAGTSPFFVGDLSVGEHVVSIRKQGFVEHRQTVRVGQGESLYVPAVELAREPIAAPDAAPEVAAPMGAAGATPTPTPTRATRTPRNLLSSSKPRVTRLAPPEKSEPVSEPVPSVTPAPPPPRTPAPPPPAETATQGDSQADLGMLRINTRPWTKVYVDGRYVGTTPQMGVPLPAGDHRVELVNEEMDMKKTIQVTIKPDQIVTKIVNLVE